MIKVVKILVVVVLVGFLGFGLAPKAQAGGCDSVTSGCGGGGCGENEKYTCECLGCEGNFYTGNVHCYEYGNCSCGQAAGCAPTCEPGETTCGACSVSCGGGTQHCGNGCPGGGFDQACNTQSCCDPNAWGAWTPASWCGVVTQSSTNACGTTRTQTSSCIECGPTPASVVGVCGNWTQTYNCGASVSGCTECGPYISAWSPALACGSVTQTRTCTENCGTDNCTGVATSQTICTECGPYISAWSACNAGTHKRTRTCTENCGVDNCSGVSLIEDCLGAVRGTLFNASDYSSCPAFNPATGYLTGLPAGVGAPSRSFGFSGTWPPLSAAATDPQGNYSISTYAPASYNYDFSPLSDIYVTGGGPKLTCVSAVATVPGNPPSCTTQPCSLVNNMSFGFWKIYGGWWQAVGGNVYGDDGIKSEIPSSLTTEMSLILPTAGNRRGLLSYGVTRPANMLGTNPNAKVSTSLWEKESKYGGQVYDWDFFDKRFNLFAKTTWSDGQAINYDDLGIGYQIFKSAGPIFAFDFSPTGTQKAIFHVNGDLRVTGNITVPSGAFLTVIAKGTITFDQAVTQADGWYVAKNISVPCKDIDGNGCDKTDSQFLGNGTFVGWSGIALGRTRGITNNTAPSEKFTYRQDLFLNAPKPMRMYTKYYKPFVP